MSRRLTPVQIDLLGQLAESIRNRYTIIEDAVRKQTQSTHVIRTGFEALDCSEVAVVDELEEIRAEANYDTTSRSLLREYADLKNSQPSLLHEDTPTDDNFVKAYGQLFTEQDKRNAVEALRMPVKYTDWDILWRYYGLVFVTQRELGYTSSQTLYEIANKLYSSYLASTDGSQTAASVTEGGFLLSIAGGPLPNFKALLGNPEKAFEAWRLGGKIVWEGYRQVLEQFDQSEEDVLRNITSDGPYGRIKQTLAEGLRKEKSITNTLVAIGGLEAALLNKFDELLAKHLQGDLNEAQLLGEMKHINDNEIPGMVDAYLAEHGDRYDASKGLFIDFAQQWIGESIGLSEAQIRVWVQARSLEKLDTVFNGLITEPLQPSFEAKWDLGDAALERIIDRKLASVDFIPGARDKLIARAKGWRSNKINNGNTVGVKQYLEEREKVAKQTLVDYLDAGIKAGNVFDERDLNARIEVLASIFKVPETRQVFTGDVQHHFKLFVQGHLGAFISQERMLGGTFNKAQDRLKGLLTRRNKIRGIKTSRAKLSAIVRNDVFGGVFDPAYSDDKKETCIAQLTRFGKYVIQDLVKREVLQGIMTILKTHLHQGLGVDEAAVRASIRSHLKRYRKRYPKLLEGEFFADVCTAVKRDIDINVLGDKSGQVAMRASIDFIRASKGFVTMQDVDDVINAHLNTLKMVRPANKKPMRIDQQNLMSYAETYAFGAHQHFTKTVMVDPVSFNDQAERKAVLESDAKARELQTRYLTVAGTGREKRKIEDWFLAHARYSPIVMQVGNQLQASLIAAGWNGFFNHSEGVAFELAIKDGLPKVTITIPVEIRGLAGRHKDEYKLASWKKGGDAEPHEKAEIKITIRAVADDKTGAWCARHDIEFKHNLRWTDPAYDKVIAALKQKKYGCVKAGSPSATKISYPQFTSQKQHQLVTQIAKTSRVPIETADQWAGVTQHYQYSSLESEGKQEVADRKLQLVIKEQINSPTSGDFEFDGREIDNPNREEKIRAFFHNSDKETQDRILVWMGERLRSRSGVPFFALRKPAVLDNAVALSFFTTDDTNEPSRFYIDPATQRLCYEHSVEGKSGPDGAYRMRFKSLTTLEIKGDTFETKTDLSVAHNIPARMREHYPAIDAMFSNEDTFKAAVKEAKTLTQAPIALQRYDNETASYKRYKTGTWTKAMPSDFNGNTAQALRVALEDYKASGGGGRKISAVRAQRVRELEAMLDAHDELFKSPQGISTADSHAFIAAFIQAQEAHDRYHNAWFRRPFQRTNNRLGNALARALPSSFDRDQFKTAQSFSGEASLIVAKHLRKPDVGVTELRENDDLADDAGIILPAQSPFTGALTSRVRVGRDLVHELIKAAEVQLASCSTVDKIKILYDAQKTQLDELHREEFQEAFEVSHAIATAELAPFKKRAQAAQIEFLKSVYLDRVDPSTWNSADDLKGCYGALFAGAAALDENSLVGDVDTVKKNIQESLRGMMLDKLMDLLKEEFKQQLLDASDAQNYDLILLKAINTVGTWCKDGLLSAEGTQAVIEGLGDKVRLKGLSYKPIPKTDKAQLDELYGQLASGNFLKVLSLLANNHYPQPRVGNETLASLAEWFGQAYQSKEYSHLMRLLMQGTMAKPDRSVQPSVPINAGMAMLLGAFAGKEGVGGVLTINADALEAVDKIVGAEGFDGAMRAEDDLGARIDALLRGIKFEGKNARAYAELFCGLAKGLRANDGRLSLEQEFLLRALRENKTLEQAADTHYMDFMKSIKTEQSTEVLKATVKGFKGIITFDEKLSYLESKLVINKMTISCLLKEQLLATPHEDCIQTDFIAAVNLIAKCQSKLEELSSALMSLPDDGFADCANWLIDQKFNVFEGLNSIVDGHTLIREGVLAGCDTPETVIEHFYTDKIMQPCDDAIEQGLTKLLEQENRQRPSQAEVFETLYYKKPSGFGRRRGISDGFVTILCGHIGAAHAQAGTDKAEFLKKLDIDVVGRVAYSDAHDAVIRLQPPGRPPSIDSESGSESDNDVDAVVSSAGAGMGDLETDVSQRAFIVRVQAGDSLYGSVDARLNASKSSAPQLGVPA
ncbi:MAG: hypothetical protein COB66_00370 [Coxiella sp. (in: Bacteria)]|nr:MAG: hypothetical protein COB66_00370 [Coxiella sp. (in: g-proteobacteria)]